MKLIFIFLPILLCVSACKSGHVGHFHDDEKQYINNDKDEFTGEKTCALVYSKGDPENSELLSDHILYGENRSKTFKPEVLARVVPSSHDLAKSEKVETFIPTIEVKKWLSQKEIGDFKIRMGSKNSLTITIKRIQGEYFKDNCLSP